MYNCTFDLFDTTTACVHTPICNWKSFDVTGDIQFIPLFLIVICKERLFDALWRIILFDGFNDDTERSKIDSSFVNDDNESKTNQTENDEVEPNWGREGDSDTRLMNWFTPLKDAMPVRVADDESIQLAEEPTSLTEAKSFSYIAAEEVEHVWLVIVWRSDRESASVIVSLNNLNESDSNIL